MKIQTPNPNKEFTLGNPPISWFLQKSAVDGDRYIGKVDSSHSYMIRIDKNGGVHVTYLSELKDLHVPLTPVAVTIESHE